MHGWTATSGPSLNLLGTFSEPSRNLPGTSSEPSRNLLGSFARRWAVADFTAGNGATRFLPGSHTWYRDGDGYGEAGLPCTGRLGAFQEPSRNLLGEAELPPGVSDAAHAVQAAMRKGSCVLWAGGTLHGASGQRKGNTASRRGLLLPLHPRLN